ncbi:MAG: hypothetical protein QNJ40_13805 [Xanthomonadales bacterium]|nr:hypothetical protein [Xanthomonadales bacterium]
MSDKKPSKRIFTRGIKDGRLLAIRNWRHMHHRDDAMIAVPLTERELRTYRRGKREGASDEEIFDRLFPDPTVERVAVSIGDLSKTQLTRLLEQMLDQPMPTLGRMSRTDLAALLKVLCAGRSKTRAYLV